MTQGQMITQSDYLELNELLEQFPVVFILRNGRRYDRLDPKTHAVLQICQSYARDMRGDRFSLQTEFGDNDVYSCQWKVTQ